MPNVHINRSITIDAPADKVYTLLANFNNWTPWSPWLITEPDAKVTIADDAKFYEWEGKRVGSGNMRIVGEKENERLDLDLAFLKPWKSTAKVWFDIKGNGASTDVSWGMDTSLPFFMFWMKKTMSALISMDYDRGLLMLKEYIEKGTVTSRLDIKGESQFDGCQYIGINTQCAMDQMGPSMKKDFDKMNEFLKNNDGIKTGPMFSIYHKWDPVKGKVEYTGGVAVDNIPSDLPNGFITGNIPATRIYSVDHVGAYQYLGNAWSAMYNMQRSKVFKHSKKTHPFEVYVNNPMDTEEKDLVTSINFAVK